MRAAQDTATCSAARTCPGAACRTSSTATASCRSRDDEAMVVELDPPRPRCGASAPTRLPGTSRSTTPTRVTSRNHRQVVADADGLVRVVLAGVRPRHRQLARHRGPARPAHDRAVVPPAGAAADPQRDRAARGARRATCPTIIRASIPTRAPTSSGPRRARRRGGTARERSELGRRAGRHRHRRVEGRGPRHRAAPRAAGRVGGDHRTQAGGARRGVGRARRARRAAPRYDAQRRRPRRRVRAGRADDRRVRPGRRVSSPTRRRSARSRRSPRSPNTTWTCCSTPDPRARCGACRPSSRTCATRDGDAS